MLKTERFKYFIQTEQIFNTMNDLIFAFFCFLNYLQQMHESDFEIKFILIKYHCLLTALQITYVSN